MRKCRRVTHRIMVNRVYLSMEINALEKFWVVPSSAGGPARAHQDCANMGKWHKGDSHGQILVLTVLFISNEHGQMAQIRQSSPGSDLGAR